MQLMTEPSLEIHNYNNLTQESLHHGTTFARSQYQLPFNTATVIGQLSNTNDNNNPLNELTEVFTATSPNRPDISTLITTIPTGNLALNSQRAPANYHLLATPLNELHVISPSFNNNNNNNIIRNNNNDFEVQATSLSVNMNIQPSSFTKNHLINNNGANLSTPDELSIKKRREDLTRRPSYRKIFNDLTGLSSPLDAPAPVAPLMPGLSQLAPPSRQSPQQSVTSSSQVQQQAPSSSPSPQALDLLSSVGVSATSLQDPTGARQSPVSVVDLQTGAGVAAANQLAQQQIQQQQQGPPPPHQTHHHHPPPTNHLHHQQQHLQHQQQHQPPPPPPQQHQARHHHHQQSQQQHHQQQMPQAVPHQPQVHQILTTTSPPITGSVGGEEATKKRELRLQKNREAAKECRRKKKEYIKCLENRVAVLENQNKALIDELKTLKDLYCKTTNE